MLEGVVPAAARGAGRVPVGRVRVKQDQGLGRGRVRVELGVVGVRVVPEDVLLEPDPLGVADPVGWNSTGSGCPSVSSPSPGD